MPAFNAYNDVSLPNRVQVFFPLVNLSLCDRKHESDQNPERPQPMLLISPWESLGERSSVTAPNDGL